MILCGAGAAAGLVVVLIRVPALAATKLEVLLGTLQGTAVCLLFGIVALLINLTLMIRRASVRLMAAPYAERAEAKGRPSPGV